MKKAFALFLAVFACIAVVSAETRISVGIAEQVEGTIRVGITNREDYDIDGARVRAFIPELGMITSTSTMDLDDDDTTSAVMHLLDDVPEGEYLVMISIKKNGRSKRAFRYVYFE
jgi:hypothetical protein